MWNCVRYTLYAPFYDLIVAWMRRARRRAVRLLDVQPGQRVLIVGAGTGEDLKYLPADADVTLVDISPAMVWLAGRRARRLGRRVEAKVMDGQRLEFGDGQFDRVILHLILAVIPNPVACIREAARVLRPRGRIGVWDKFLDDRVRAGVARRAINVVTNVLFSDINRRLGELLEAAGLEIERQEPSLLGGLFKIAIVRKA